VTLDPNPYQAASTLPDTAVRASSQDSPLANALSFHELGWNVFLCAVFAWVYSNIFEWVVNGTVQLFTKTQLDIYTLSNLANFIEPFAPAFVLFSLSTYFPSTRGLRWRLVYAVVGMSFLLRSIPTDARDVVVASVFVLMVLPVLTFGRGWLAVMRACFNSLAARNTLGNPSR